ncbi:cobalamin biosynthesis protein [Noviherbaspirillum soli]|uniref:cobalamin biosynthesis protein n=1 Tax=Noviherbaspirillum soli TaxID=1064518 RepID=UPI0022649446|nr:cobalamin biosynthesis protein [Noviherbaspirillum soli]
MLSTLSVSGIALCVAVGVLLDLLLGEARRWHPLVGFGRWAATIERHGNSGGHRTLRGGLAWLLAVLPPVALVWMVASSISSEPAAYALHILCSISV